MGVGGGGVWDWEIGFLYFCFLLVFCGGEGGGGVSIAIKFVWRCVIGINSTYINQYRRSRRAVYSRRSGGCFRYRG